MRKLQWNSHFNKETKGFASCHQSTHMKAHTHDFYEIFWGISGSCIHHVNEREQQLHKNDLVLMRPTDAHGTTNLSKQPYRFYNVALSKETFNDLYKRYSFIKDLWPLDSQLPPIYRLNPALAKWLSASVRDIFTYQKDLFTLERFLINLLFELRQEQDSINSNLRGPMWLKKAIRHIQREGDFEYGSRQIAHVSGKSQAHVCRELKKFYNTTPSALLNEIRLDVASMLLTTTTKDILEITHMCSFDNLSYFYRCFKNKMGLTPRQFRIKHLKMVSPID